MKVMKSLAPVPGLDSIASAHPASTLPTIDLPSKIGPEDLEEAFVKLSAAVPPLVGRDPVGQSQERLVIQGIHKVVEAAKSYAPENPWDRESPYDKALERVISARLQASGVKSKARIQKNSPLETRIARCIFPDRRRAHVASAVIRAAIAAGKGSDELLSFIEQSHGTEAIRRKTRGPSANDALQQMWKTKPLATISLPRDLVGEQVGDKPKQMLFTIRRTGEVDIRWIGDNAATARSALAAFAKAMARSVGSHDASVDEAHAS